MALSPKPTNGRCGRNITCTWPARYRPTAQAEAEDAMVKALRIPLPDTPSSTSGIKRLARTERGGYLHQRMEEDNLITAARRRMMGKVSIKTSKVCVGSLPLPLRKGT